MSFIAGISFALLHHEFCRELDLLAFAANSVLSRVCPALGRGADDRVLLHLAVFIVIELSADSLVAAAEMSVFKIIGVAAVGHVAVCDSSVNIENRVVDVVGNRVALFVKAAQRIGVKVVRFCSRVGVACTFNCIA